MSIELPEGQGVKNRRFWTVLDRMIVADLAKTLVAVLSVIIIILVSRKFVDILGLAIKGKIANETVFSIFGLKTILVGINFLPDAIFISILIVLGRMYRDYEMAALASAGVGPGIIYRSVFMIIFPLSVCAFGLSLYSAPWAEARIEELKHMDKQTMDLRGVSAGKFSEYSKGDMVFYVEEIDENNRMHNIFVQNRLHGKLAIINARSGTIQDLPGGSYIILEDGERVQGQPGRADFFIETFDEYALRIELKNSRLDYDLDAVPTEALWSLNDSHSIAELQSRFAIPLGILVLSALAIPLAQLSPRDGLYANILVAFLIDFSYANLQLFFQGLLINGVIPAWFSVSAAYFLMLLILIVLLVRFFGRDWVEFRLKQWVGR